MPELKAGSDVEAVDIWGTLVESLVHVHDIPVAKLEFFFPQALPHLQSSSIKAQYVTRVADLGANPTLQQCLAIFIEL